MEAKKAKIIKKKVRRRIKLGSVLMLLITFSSTSYAWFLYATKVSTGVSAYIKAWKISFESGETEIEQNMSFEISDIYPGMDSFTDSVTVKNRGETNANISFSYESARVLNAYYNTSGALTSEDLRQHLITDYPFHINVIQSSPILAPNSQETFSLQVTWPFESGDDDVDTYWGEQAYDFKYNNPDLPCIEVTIKITAVQSATSSDSD